MQGGHPVDEAVGAEMSEPETILGTIGNVEIVKHPPTSEAFMGYEVGPMIEYRPKNRKPKPSGQWHVKSIEPGEIVVE